MNQNLKLPGKSSENEIYTIKESNIKRIYEIIKNSYTAKPNEECIITLPKVIQENNRILIDSMNETRKMYDQIFEINKTKNYFKGKLEKKFQECQSHQYNSIKNEETQKSLNASMNIIKNEISK